MKADLLRFNSTQEQNEKEEDDVLENAMTYLAIIGMQRRVYVVAPNLDLRSREMGCLETLQGVS